MATSGIAERAYLAHGYRRAATRLHRVDKGFSIVPWRVPNVRLYMCLHMSMNRIPYLLLPMLGRDLLASRVRGQPERHEVSLRRDLQEPRHVPVYRHVCRHAYRRGCRYACRYAFRRMCRDECGHACRHAHTHLRDSTKPSVYPATSMCADGCTIGMSSYESRCEKMLKNKNGRTVLRNCAEDMCVHMRTNTHMRHVCRHLE